MTEPVLVLLILLYIVSAVLFWYLGASNERKKYKPKIDLSELRR